MLSLYEATQLRVHGEDILEEALDFTTHFLNLIASFSEPVPIIHILFRKHGNLIPGPRAAAPPALPQERPCSEQAQQLLIQPLHRGMQRVQAQHFISFYEEDECRNEKLLQLAKIEFNRLQLLHRNELSQIQ
ncbi:putative terpene synthase 6, partial [Bienertia sinuspersici]